MSAPELGPHAGKATHINADSKEGRCMLHSREAPWLHANLSQYDGTCICPITGLEHEENT